MRTVFKVIYRGFGTGLFINDLYALDCAEMATLADKYNLAGIRAAVSEGRGIQEELRQEAMRPGNIVRNEHRPPPGTKVEAIENWTCALDRDITAKKQGTTISMDVAGRGLVVGVL
jgi:hypothetical protein